MNCLVKDAIEETIEGKRDEEKDVSNYWMTLRKKRYWNLKQKALDRTLSRTGFGTGCGPFARYPTF